MILVMKRSVVVTDSDSKAKLPLCYSACVSDRGWVCYAVFRRAWPIQAIGQGLPMSHEWGGHSGVRKAADSVRTLKVRRQTGERTPTSLWVSFS